VLPSGVFNIYFRTIGRWTYNQADVVLCYTDGDKQRVRDLGVTSPIEVVPNGTDTDRFTPDGPISDLIDASGPITLFLGRLVEAKCPEIAIEIDKFDPTVELYLCGDGPLRNMLKQRAIELDIQDSITFVGQVPSDEVPAAYRQADVLILPGRAEGVPRTIMEALSSGVPVVSSDLPQIRSVFGDLVSYINENNLSETIKK